MIDSKILESFMIPEDLIATEGIGKFIKQLIIRKDEKKMSEIRSKQLIDQYHDGIWQFMAVYCQDIEDLCKKYNTEAMYILHPLIATNMKLDSKLSGNNTKKFANQWYSVIKIGGYDYDSNIHNNIMNDVNVYFTKWNELAVKYLPYFRLMHLTNDKDNKSIEFILVYNQYIDYEKL